MVRINENDYFNKETTLIARNTRVERANHQQGPRSMFFSGRAKRRIRKRELTRGVLNSVPLKRLETRSKLSNSNA